MADTRPTAVEKAIRMLDESESLPNPEDRAKAMVGPISILKAYVNQNPTSNTCESIETRMVTHLCKHASRLKAHGD